MKHLTGRRAQILEWSRSKWTGLVLVGFVFALAAALSWRRWPALGFSDCLMLQLARKAGHLPLGTFDRGLGKIEGSQKL